MTKEEIIRDWKIGHTKFQVANNYMEEYNKSAKRRGENKINKNEALAFVEPIIFEYETKDWK